MSKSEKLSNVNKLDFETALSELEEIVQHLESGETSLEGSIDAYERGVALKKHCESKLREAQLRVEKIENDGTIEAKPLEED